MASVRFVLPLTRNEAKWAVRLLEACTDAYIEAIDNPSSWPAIYDNVSVVPADLAEHVRRIDPCRLGCGEGFLASYQGRGTQLWKRTRRSGLLIWSYEFAELEFITAWLGEILRKFDHLKAVGFEIGCNEAFPKNLGGGACFVTKGEIKWIFMDDWLEQQMNALANQSP